MTTQVLPIQPAAPAAEKPSALTHTGADGAVSKFKKITISFEAEIAGAAKNVVLHVWQDRVLIEDVLAALGQSQAAAFLAELLRLGHAAVSSYQDAEAVDVTPAEILKLLPDLEKLATPAAAASGATASGAAGQAAAGDATAKS